MKTAIEWLEKRYYFTKGQLIDIDFQQALKLESNKNQKFDEMLEMLKELVYAFKDENLHEYQEERLAEAKQLIKEATEL
jgi:hypothetical protein